MHCAADKSLCQYVKRKAEDAAKVQYEYTVLRHLEFVGVHGVVRAVAFDAPAGELTLQHAGVDLLEFYQERWDAVDDALRMSLCQQLLRAVRALHDMQAVHLDLKMENVCVDDAGTVRLIDFETSKLRVPRDCRATYVGSPARSTTPGDRVRAAVPVRRRRVVVRRRRVRGVEQRPPL